VGVVKIQFRGQFVVDRLAPESLVDQLAGQLRQVIETGRFASGARLPSTRSLARCLGVSRNTVLTAYDDLVSRGFVRRERGAGMFVAVAIPTVDVGAVMREAQFPLLSIAVRDLDGNALYVSC
jgi:DNA-binding GntR family transcriptional regulator